MKSFIARFHTVSRKAADWSEKHPLGFLSVLSLCLNLILEIMSRHSFISAFSFLLLHPYLFLLNGLIIFASLSLSLLFRKRGFAVLLISIIWILLGLTDFILLFMRTTPFSMVDILLIPSCISVIFVYLNIPELILIGILLGLLILSLVFCFKHMRTYSRNLKKSGLTVFLSLGGMVLILFLSVVIGAVPDEYPELHQAYLDYGFTYCFTRSIYDRGIRRPADYSESEIENIIDEMEEDLSGILETDDAPPAAEQPDIIFVQLESFFDPARLKDISFTTDPVPVFTGLRKNFPSGYLTVPSVGAGTANTEFEVLTGMNLDYFGAGEYPYNTVLLDKTCESAAYILKEKGYSTHALHDNVGSFYNRNLVYPNLGFDTFTSLEYMNDVHYNLLGWAKDFVLTEEILKCLDSSPEPDFVFAVSVQGHGRYPDEVISSADEEEKPLEKLLYWFTEEAETEDDAEETGGHHSGNVTSAINTEQLKNLHIQLKNAPEDEALAVQYLYYANELYEMDAFIGALVYALSQYPEPVVLVLYGDHLPPFGYTGEDLNDGTTPFESEYIIWSNDESLLSTAEDSSESADRDLASYQLLARVFELLDIHEGTIPLLHQTGMNDPDYEENLKMLEYDMLYGEMAVWNGESPYAPCDMQMGVTPVRVTGIIQVGDLYYVRGSGFTPFSTVLLDEDDVETHFVSSSVLAVYREDWDEDALSLSVVQGLENGSFLSSSEPYNLQR